MRQTHSQTYIIQRQKRRRLCKFTRRGVTSTPQHQNSLYIRYCVIRNSGRLLSTNVRILANVVESDATLEELNLRST